MNWKRLLLVLLTIFSLSSVVFALSQSLGEPQVQAQLELYQTDLILNVAEYRDEPSVEQEQNQSKIQASDITKNLVGENPYTVAEKQYQKTLDLTQQSLTKLENQEQIIASNGTQTPRQSLKQSIKQNQLIDELDFKLGIIYAYEKKLDLAGNSWTKMADQELANLLQKIWIKKNKITKTEIEIISQKIDGWFANVTLAQAYQNNNDQSALATIETQQQQRAEKAFYKLLSLSVIPILGGVIGFALIFFLIVQWLLKKEESLLAKNADQLWESPWDGETVWQVFIVGFFFLSQVILPVLVSVSGFNPANVGIKGKALYVLATYLLMTGGGLSVLYLSIKSFFPLPEGWFQQHNRNWYWWGIGGYLAAIPLVFFVSLLNQQIWQGRGGSNPLLLLTLQSQDKFAIAVLFFTASVAAPIFEEIMFRGFLLPSLTRYLPVSGAIIVSALIFAIAHLSLAEIIPLAVLGIILGIIYTRSRSLLASIMVHSLWNSGTLFTLFILGSSLD